MEHPTIIPLRQALAADQLNEALHLYQQAAIHALKSHGYRPSTESRRILSQAASLLTCVTQHQQRLRGRA